MTKIEVRTIEPEGAPLAVTESGCVVCYVRSDDLDSWGGPVAFIQDWLDHEAQSPSWKEQPAQRRQYSVF